MRPAVEVKIMRNLLGSWVDISIELENQLSIPLLFSVLPSQKILFSCAKFLVLQNHSKNSRSFAFIRGSMVLLLVAARLRRASAVRFFN